MHNSLYYIEAERNTKLSRHQFKSYPETRLDLCVNLISQT